LEFLIENLYTFLDFKTKCILYNRDFINEYNKFLLEIYKGDLKITDKNKEVCIILDNSNSTLMLDYIGFKKEFRNKGILKQLHNNCYKVLQTVGIKYIKLKPLTNVLTLWIYLGFDFVKPLEEIRAKLTLINYLKKNNVISIEQVSIYDKMSLQEIVKKHKELFKQKDFPAIVEKELYYSYLQKAIK